MCIRDRDYTAFTQLPNGTTVKVIGTDGDWLKVILPEKIGYVYSLSLIHILDTWMFFKWIFKTFCAVLIVTNTWNIVMGIFDVGQSVVNSSAGAVSYTHLVPVKWNGCGGAIISTIGQKKLFCMR